MEAPKQFINTLLNRFGFATTAGCKNQIDGVIGITASELERELQLYFAFRYSRRPAPELSNPFLYEEYFAKFGATASGYWTETPKDEAFRNAALALCSEASEALENPTDTKEIGDLYWYTAMMCKLAGYNLDNLFRNAVVQSTNRQDTVHNQPIHALVVRDAGLIASYLKKTAEKALSIDYAVVEPLVIKLIEHLCELAGCADQTPGHIMRENLAKLAARHPKGFDPNYKSAGESL